jgi:hypothetical protein
MGCVPGSSVVGGAPTGVACEHTVWALLSLALTPASLNTPSAA